MPRKYSTLAQRVALAGHRVSLADLEADPEALISARDLAALGLVCSYSGIGRWIERRWLPDPIILPNGRRAWKAGEIAAIYDRKGGHAASDKAVEGAEDGT